MERKLYEASLTGNVQALNALLQEDQLILDRISLTCFNETPLHIAALRGHLDFVKVVLSQNPKLAKAVDSVSRTPLHLAAAEGHLEIVQELLNVASPNVCSSRDQDGRTPLHLAAMNEQLDVVKVLVQANPAVAREGPEIGETILHMCVTYNRFQALKALMKLWNEEELAKLTDHEGNTLLHTAAANKQIQILKYLLNKPSVKANGNAVNKNGITAVDVLDYCPRDFKALETREILMEAGILRAKDLRPSASLSTTPKSSNAISSIQNKPKGFFSRVWDRYLNDDRSWLEKQRGILIVAVLLVAVTTFHGGINPPGGFISNGRDGQLGNAVGAELYMESFSQYVRYNTITMIISLTIVILLISGFPLRNKLVMWLLTIGTLFMLVMMVFTYIKSLADMSPDTYVNGATIIICLIWTVLCGLVALVHTIFFVVWVIKSLFKFRRSVTEIPMYQHIVEV